MNADAAIVLLVPDSAVTPLLLCFSSTLRVILAASVLMSIAIALGRIFALLRVVDEILMLVGLAVSGLFLNLFGGEICGRFEGTFDSIVRAETAVWERKSVLETHLAQKVVGFTLVRDA